VSDDQQEVICIYCLLPKKGSAEHLVQRGIGGNMTGRRICQGCNTGMSDIDQHLADNTIVSMLRVANTPKGSFPVKLGGELFTTDSAGRKVPVTLRNEYQPELQPMMRFTFKGGGQVAVGIQLSDPSDAERLAKFLEKHRKGAYDVLFCKVVDWLEPEEAAVVMHREKDGYLAASDGAVGARARTLLNEKAEELIAILRKPLPEEGTLDKPWVEVSSELRLNHLYRAVTKLAFNLFAHRTPEDLALSSDFHAARDYVAGRDVRSTTNADGDPEPDGRFVSWMLQGKPMVFRDLEHTVVLTVHNREYCALVTLYRQLVFFVRLGPARGTRPWFAPPVLVVRGDRQETRWLELAECVELMRAY
jgi:hypothetical protein